MSAPSAEPRRRRIDPKVASTRGRLAALHRDPTVTEQELANARRDHHAARLEHYINTIVAEAPPLTDAQRAHLASLLRAPSTRGQASA